MMSRRINTEDLTSEYLQAAFLQFKKMRNQSHARCLSWEHCIEQFSFVFDELNTKELKVENIQDDLIDTLCLHLGFYLASWGMMRGSTDLLDYDYKIHTKAVKHLLSYPELFRMDSSTLCKEENLDKLEKLSTELQNAYTVEQERPFNNENVSNILITKILMGTLGIVPAYDTFVTEAVKHYNITTANFNTDSFKKLSYYFETHLNEEIKNLTKEMQNLFSLYTPMKVIDSLLWELGKPIAERKKQESKKTEQN